MVSASAMRIFLRYLNDMTLYMYFFLPAIVTKSDAAIDRRTVRWQFKLGCHSKNIVYAARDYTGCRVSEFLEYTELL